MGFGIVGINTPLCTLKTLLHDQCTNDSYLNINLELKNCTMFSLILLPNQYTFLAQPLQNTARSFKWKFILFKS